MKIDLTTYLQDIESEYQTCKKEWESIQNEIKRLDDAYNRERANYSELGNVKKLEELNENKKKLLFELSKIRDKFDESSKKIVKKSDKVFNDYFRYNPSKIDQNGIAILNNGGLSVAEIMELADNYFENGNMTMYYMVAEKLKKYADKPLGANATNDELIAKGYYQKAKKFRESRPDHELYNGFSLLCLAGLRDDNVLALGMQNIHDEEYNKHLVGAKEIVMDIKSPWE